MTTERGAFIVLEGLDRSGKTTQTAKLVEGIQNSGRKCKLIKFPGMLHAWLAGVMERSNHDDWEDDRCVFAKCGGFGRSCYTSPV